MTSAAATSALRPPPAAARAADWLRRNLFNTWYNSLVTVLCLGLAYALLRPALEWAISAAQWRVISDNLRLLMVGQYPAAETWRVWACVYTLGVLAGLSWGAWGARFRTFAAVLAAAGVVLALLPLTLNDRLGWLGLAVAVGGGFAAGLARPRLLRRVAAAGWLLYFPFVLLIVGGWSVIPGLPRVSSNLWGGLLLTFLMAVVGILFSFPFGVLLALGRRSQLPAVRLFATLYIELIRGVPLVTLLFMASIMLPLFLPPELRIERVVRAMIGFVMFSAAYVAEDVRGGLQAVGRGQFEAAQALGLPGSLVMGLIVLPQALRAIIPALVGQFISLFKDTSLVAIIGLFDLLNIGQSVVANPAYLGLHREIYLFAGLVYWVFSYSMAYAARRLEIALGVGER